MAEEFNTIDGKLTGRTKTINCTIYHYISTTGEYLTTTSINESSGNPTTSVATFVQANSFKNNVAVVAKMYYLRNSTNYFNNYHIVSTNGNEVAESPQGLSTTSVVVQVDSMKIFSLLVIITFFLIKL